MNPETISKRRRSLHEPLDEIEVEKVTVMSPGTKLKRIWSLE